MSNLTIRLTVPLSAPITFSRWLPIGDPYAITLTEDAMSAKLWFDVECSWWAMQRTEEELKRHLNVMAHRVQADVTVADLPADLLTYIAARDFSRAPTDEEEPLQERYDELAERVYRLVLHVLNRLLAYARSQKGQYWLSLEAVDPGRMYEFFGPTCTAKAQIDDQDPFRFGPRNVLGLPHQLQLEGDRFIHAEEWDEIRAFVTSSRSYPLARTLLVGAEALAASGHGRSALAEAVTALEITLFAFAKNPAADRAFGPTLAQRLGVQTLSNQVKHMGLSGSIRYLLPILFDESDLPQTVLEGCQEAISQRQNVVHNGQSAVDEGTLRRCLVAIRSMCEFLDGMTLAS